MVARPDSRNPRVLHFEVITEAGAREWARLEIDAERALPRLDIARRLGKRRRTVNGQGAVRVEQTRDGIRTNFFLYGAGGDENIVVRVRAGDGSVAQVHMYVVAQRGGLTGKQRDWDQKQQALAQQQQQQQMAQPQMAPPLPPAPPMTPQQPSDVELEAELLAMATAQEFSMAAAAVAVNQDQLPAMALPPPLDVGLNQLPAVPPPMGYEDMLPPFVRENMLQCQLDDLQAADDNWILGGADLEAALDAVYQQLGLDAAQLLQQ